MRMRDLIKRKTLMYSFARGKNRISRSFLCLALCISLILTLFTGCGKTIASPAKVTATVSGGNITVTWTAVEAADSYRVLKKSSSDAEYKFLDDTNSCSYTDDHVVPGTTYFYKVCAISDGKLSEGKESAGIDIPDSPIIMSVKMLSKMDIEIQWNEMSAEAYRLYGAFGEQDWELVTETKDCQYLVHNDGKYTRFCISAVMEKDGIQTETAKSEAATLVGECKINSVTRLDKDTAAILFESETNTQDYVVYRSSSANGEYVPIGRSYENVYYDTTLNGGTGCYYRIQPVADIVEGCLSEPVILGTNARPVSGFLTFMYHEFVTQEDLDSGVAFDEYAIWKDEFENDLIWLRDNGYTTITTAQLTAWLKGTGTLPSKPVMLTIDDGKYGVYKNAWPLLQKYQMTAVLSVIGEEIDKATQDPGNRTNDVAPYCTWDEIGEMSDSGAIEIVSHTYTKHRYDYEGHQGANIAENESEDTFFQSANKDYRMMDTKLKKITGSGTVAMAYPYSKRSAASDRVWMRCGYSVLLAGDDRNVRTSSYNLFVQEAGINYYSSLIRRIARMTGKPIRQYIQEESS